MLAVQPRKRTDVTTELEVNHGIDACAYVSKLLKNSRMWNAVFFNDFVLLKNYKKIFKNRIRSLNTKAKSWKIVFSFWTNKCSVYTQKRTQNSGSGPKCSKRGLLLIICL